MSQIPLEPLHLILIGLELFKQLTQSMCKNIASWSLQECFCNMLLLHSINIGLGFVCLRCFQCPYCWLHNIQDFIFGYFISFPLSSIKSSASKLGNGAIYILKKAHSQYSIKVKSMSGKHCEAPNLSSWVETGLNLADDLRSSRKLWRWKCMTVKVQEVCNNLI